MTVCPRKIARIRTGGQSGVDRAALDFAIEHNIPYGEGDMNFYDFYLPESGKENYSLILHIHGGGFSTGDKKEGKIICEYYASKGYVTASVNYSLMDRKHDSNLNVMTKEILE